MERAHDLPCPEDEEFEGCRLVAEVLGPIVPRQPMPKDEHEALLRDFEERVQQRIGKWGATIVGTIVVASFLAAGQWFGVLNRVERLESWAADRQRGIEEYDQFRRSLESRLGRLEAGQETMIGLLKERPK